MVKRNFRILVFLLLLGVAAVGLFGGFSADGLAAGQSNKHSRAARNKTDSTDSQSSRATKKNRSCKQVCDDTYHDCKSYPVEGFPSDWGQPGSCSYKLKACTEDCPSTQKQRKPQRLPKV